MFNDSTNNKINYVDENRASLRVIAWELLQGPNTLMDPCRSNIGGPDPCGVDAYGNNNNSHLQGARHQQS